jgi:hypothetical protein
MSQSGNFPTLLFPYLFIDQENIHRWLVIKNIVAGLELLYNRIAANHKLLLSARLYSRSVAVLLPLNFQYTIILLQWEVSYLKTMYFLLLKCNQISLESRNQDGQFQLN